MEEWRNRGIGEQKNRGMREWSIGEKKNMGMRECRNEGIGIDKNWMNGAITEWGNGRM